MCVELEPIEFAILTVFEQMFKELDMYDSNKNNQKLVLHLCEIIVKIATKKKKSKNYRQII